MTSHVVRGSLLATLLLLNACALSESSPEDERLAAFEHQLEDYREQLRIPGMSAVIVKDQKVLWAKGFGYADQEKRIPATPETLYSIASITKTFAAELVMQLVDQGKVDLEEPVSHYSSDFKDDSVRIKHLLSHTSDGPTPGERYQYNPDRYEYLTAVIEKKTGKSFQQAMVETFLEPLGMSGSVPGPKVVDDPASQKRYSANLAKFAQPYTLYGDSEIVLAAYPPKFFGASAGLLSNVQDLAKYDVALDRHVLMKKETQEMAWTPFVSNSGQRLPYGFGWYVVDYNGVRLIWHGGNWGTGFSAIYVKVPERNLSLIMLANSEALNDHLYAIWNGSEEIMNNVFACAFVRRFVFEGARGLDCESRSQAALAKWREKRRERARVVVDVDPKILQAYAGEYQFEKYPTMILHVTADGGKLFVDVPRGRTSQAFARSPTTFFFKFRPAEMTFVREGSAARLEWAEFGEVLRANKIK